MTTNGFILHAADLTKSYGRGDASNKVLRGVDLAIRPGEFLAVMGASGCGKSTLLHILGLMDRPDAGSLKIHGREVTDAPEAERIRLRRRSLGFVFQRFNLLTTISAADNIATSFRVRGLPVDRNRIGSLLDRMGASHVADRKSGQMSIGEQQRVAVARALAHEPDILLADEPTGCLDSASAESLLELFRQANLAGQTIVMITHSPAAAEAAGRTLHMKDGLIEDGNAP